MDLGRLRTPANRACRSEGEAHALQTKYGYPLADSASRWRDEPALCRPKPAARGANLLLSGEENGQGCSQDPGHRRQSSPAVDCTSDAGSTQGILGLDACFGANVR